MTTQAIDRGERGPPATSSAGSEPRHSGHSQSPRRDLTVVPAVGARLRGQPTPRALILEDDESVSTTLGAILADEGFTVSITSAVADALAAIERERFDVALLDLVVEDGDGLTVLTRLHETSPDTVSLILTGYGSLETAVQAIRGGARAYLLKPCSVPDLKATIADELELRRRSEAAATRRQLAFFAEASSALASSLDHEATLATVARLAVPRLTEWCMVYLVGDDGELRRVAAVHADAAKDELIQQLVHGYPLTTDSSHPVRRAVRSGMTIVTPEAPPEEIDRYATDAEHARILRGLAVRSAAIVPLIARGQTLGAMSFAPTGTRLGAGTLDLAVAEELARRAALAIDNARLYRQAQEAIRTRDEFLGTASHDLKGPLAAVSAQAQLLKRRAERLMTPEGERLVTGLASIQATVGRMTAIVNELLDVAHLRMGQELALEHRRVDLVTLTERVAAEAQSTTTRHALRVDAAVTSLTGQWDGFRLERVVGNLLSNAVKFSPDGGDVQVTIRLEEGEGQRWAVLAVRDRGIGIPPDDLPRIFDRFRRAQNVIHRIRGEGIGLAGTRHIVEQHGGSLAVASREGEGSTFTVRLPLGDAFGPEESSDASS